MNSSVVFSCPGIILNTCCLIDLYASGYMSDILRSLPVPVAIAAYTYQQEKLPAYLQIADDGEPSPDPIRLQSIIQSGMLTIASPTNEERASMTNFAASVRVDGEAYTLALALHRQWAIGVDDLHARRWFRLHVQQLPLFSTATFINYWAERSSLPAHKIHQMIQKIWSRTRYQPLLDDPIHGWWKQYMAL